MACIVPVFLCVMDIGVIASDGCNLLVTSVIQGDALHMVFGEAFALRIGDSIGDVMNIH